NADARLELETKLRGFARAYGKLVAKSAKLDLVVDAGSELMAAADGAVGDTAESLAASTTNIQAAIGAACAVEAIGDAGGMLAEASESVSASAAAVGEVTASLE